MNVFKAYGAENRDTLIVAAREYGARYIVVKKEFDLPTLNAVHRNKTFFIYDIDNP